MSTLGGLERFTKSFKTMSQDFNFQLMSGGRFKIPNEQKKKFISRLSRFDSKRGFPLLPRPRPTGPFSLDIDLRLKDGVRVPDDVFISMTHNFLTTLQNVIGGEIDWPVVLTRRNGSYLKTENVWSSGFHVYIHNLVVAKPTMEKFYSLLMKNQDWISHLKDYPVTNPPEDIIDKRVCLRNTGLICIGLNKLNIDCTPHYIFFVGPWRNHFDEDTVQRMDYGWQNKTKIERKRYKGVLELLYEWPFTVQPPTSPTTQTKISFPPPFLTKTEGVVAHPPQTQETVVKSNTEPALFDLLYFLDVCEGSASKFNHGKWLQLIYFCRIVKLDRNFVCDALNRYFKPENQQENYTAWDNFKQQSAVGPGSIITMLRDYSTKSWDCNRVFCKPVFKYHNDSEMFLTNKKVWKRSEIFSYFDSVYGYTFGQGKTSFLYREQKCKRFGNTFRKVTDFVITRDIPFDDKGSDIVVMCEPGLAKMKRIVTKIKNQTCKTDKDFELRTDISKLSTCDDYDKIHKTLVEKGYPPEPTKISLGTLFTQAKQTGVLSQRFYSYDFIPFFTQEQNVCPPDIFNIWKGFDLEPYRNTDVDIKNTLIWRWFWEALCDSDEYKLKFLFTWFAMKIQQPHRRVMKFLILFSRKTSTGKTTIQKFSSKLLSEDHVLMVQSVKEFLSENNYFLLGRLCVVIDDVDKIKSKSVSDSLKSRITEPTFTCKKLYKDKVSCRTYADLITTSNSRNPVFIDSDDRRSELIAINPVLESEGVKFWSQYYEELDNPEIMGAWFDFFAKFPIELNIRSKDVRFDVHLLNQQKLSSLKITHRWLINFFQDEECFESTYTPYHVGNYFAHINFRMELGTQCLILTLSRAFEYFQHWKTSEGSQLKLNKQTFIEDLADAGIKKQRVKITKADKTTIRQWGFKFSKPHIQKNMTKFYNFAEDDLKFNWCFDDIKDFKRLQQAYHNNKLIFKQSNTRFD